MCRKILKILCKNRCDTFCVLRHFWQLLWRKLYTYIQWVETKIWDITIGFIVSLWVTPPWPSSRPQNFLNSLSTAKSYSLLNFRKSNFVPPKTFTWHNIMWYRHIMYYPQVMCRRQKCFWRTFEMILIFEPTTYYQYQYLISNIFNRDQVHSKSTI